MCHFRIECPESCRCAVKIFMCRTEGSPGSARPDAVRFLLSKTGANEKVKHGSDFALIQVSLLLVIIPGLGRKIWPSGVKFRLTAE